MSRIQKLEEIQAKALKVLENNEFKGTVMLCPGSGKTFLAFKAAYRMLELGLISGDKPIIYFLAETNARKITVFNDEAPKFKNVYGKDILTDFEVRFACYQGKPVEKTGGFSDGSLVIFDEIHDTLTSDYHVNITNCKCKYMIGLTGAMSMETSVFPGKLPEDLRDRVFQSSILTESKQIGEACTKGQMLSMFCPVIFRYPTSQAIADGIIAPYKTFIIKHRLSNGIPYRPLWKGGSSVSETEFHAKKSLIADDPLKPHYVKTMAKRDLTVLLYQSLSKVYVTKALLARLGASKTIVFGDRLDILRLITKNTVTSKNVAELVNKFNSGEINVIASSKILQQGITLEGVENVVFFSYSSKWHNFEQRRARIRFLEDKQAQLFFLVTQGTYEERWIRELCLEKNDKGAIIRKHNLNVQKEVESTTILDWYAKSGARVH